MGISKFIILLGQGEGKDPIVDLFAYDKMLKVIAHYINTP